MDIISICLTFLAFSHMTATINFHGQLIVANPEKLSHHLMSICLCSKWVFVGFSHYLLGLNRVNIFEQHHVMVPFVKHIIFKKNPIGNLLRVFYHFLKCWEDTLYLSCNDGYHKTTTSHLVLLLLGSKLVNPISEFLLVAHLFLNLSQTLKME